MSPRGRRLAWSLGLALAVLAATAPAVVAGRSTLAKIPERVAIWAEGLGPWGPVGYGAVFAVGVVLMVPAVPLTLMAGAAFGPAVGAVVSIVASNVGSTASFLIARHLARDAVARALKGHPRFEAIDRAVAADGFKVVLLLRLSPVIPFGLQNALHGLGSIRFRTFALAGAVGMLPINLAYSYLGHLGRIGLAGATGSKGRTSAEWALIGLGVVATLAVSAYAARLARRALAIPGR